MSAINVFKPTGTGKCGYIYFNGPILKVDYLGHKATIKLDIMEQVICPWGRLQSNGLLDSKGNFPSSAKNSLVIVEVSTLDGYGFKIWDGGIFTGIKLTDIHKKPTLKSHWPPRHSKKSMAF